MAIYESRIFGQKRGDRKKASQQIEAVTEIPFD
jgi:hypothetical protein